MSNPRIIWRNGVVTVGALLAAVICAYLGQKEVALALIAFVSGLWLHSGRARALLLPWALFLVGCSSAAGGGYTAEVGARVGRVAPLGTMTDRVEWSVHAAPTCTVGSACMYALNTDGLLYTKDANELTMKLHAAQGYRTSSNCAGLSSPANGDVCFDTTIPAFRFYSSGWTSGPVDDTLVVHKAGTENITGAKTFMAQLTMSGAGIAMGSQKITLLGTPTVSTDATTKAYVDAAAPEINFSATCTITSAAASTPVTCLADAAVPAGKIVHLLGWHAKVHGGTLWATTSSCHIADSSGAGGTGVIFVTMAVAALTANAFVTDASANVTAADAYSLNAGGTATKGLLLACDVNGTGSDLVVTVFGSIK